MSNPLPAVSAPPNGSPLDRPWQDTTRSAEERIKALSDAMTLEEKLAQLGSVWEGVEDVSGNVAPMQDVFGRKVDFDDAVAHGIGHLTRPFGTKPTSAADGATRVQELQRRVVTAGRLGIPAIVHEECLTGFTTFGATVYPTSLAWAATFAPNLIRRMAVAIGSDLRSLGVHSGLAPVLDVVRDYRWGRVEETLGEDPYLVAQAGSAYVQGLEHAGIVATLKHFAGYSASRSARNHAPVTIGPREFRDIILAPFEKAVRDGRVRSVMNSYSDIDGLPAGANAELLTGILRHEWGFTGTVVSDYWSVAFLKTMHLVADDLGGAAALALSAGIDVELPDTLAYGQPLLEQVRAGLVDEELVDRALFRVLRQKLELGLLDAEWSPEADVTAPDIDLDSPANREIAREIAEKSIVLLENGASDAPFLPLGADDCRVSSIALIGPLADDPGALFGCYSFPNHVIPKFPEFGMGIEARSIAEALRAEWPNAAITTQQGVLLTAADRSGIAAAAETAAAADVAVLAVGDRSGLFGLGTSGEGCDAEDLSLPGLQDELVEAILATGTPVILLVVSGRPYALGGYQRRCAAIVQAFFPGEEGGAAIAGVLSGRINPSGHLPVQIPRIAGGSPGTYLAPPYGLNSEGISNLDPTPAFPFGYGMSYTEFEYRGVEVSAASVSTAGTVDVSVTVANTGSRAGEDVVQLYLTDPVATVTRPVRRLIGFARVSLEPGAASRVTFHVHADVTSFTGADLTRRVEPGDIVLTVASSAADDGVQARVTLTGEVRHVGVERVLDVPVTTAQV